MSRYFISWSGGKESSLACHKALSEGLEVSHLLNMATADAKMSMTHGLDSSLLQAQSECLGIPLVQEKTTWDGYERNFKMAVRALKKEGITGGIFGDIDLQGHRDWVERVCAEVGVEAVLPLWGLSREQVLDELISSGFEAVLVCIKKDILDESWLGRKVSKQFVDDLKRINVDVCGEGGEYHTLVTDGPMFKKRIEIKESEIIMEDEYGFLNILKHEIKGGVK